MFNRVKPSGWSFGELLTNTQMDALDTDHADAIDGVGAGSYTITAPLEIEGDDITLGTTGDDVTIGDDLEVVGNTTLGTNSSNAVTVNATATFSAAPAMGAGLDVLSGTTQLGGPLSANDTATFNGATTLAGAVSLTDPLTISSNGRFIFRAPGAIGNAPGSLVVTTTNHYYCPASTLSADRTWTIDDTGAANGDWLLVKNKDVNWTIIVNDPAAANLANLKEGTAVDTAFIIRIAGTWTVLWTSS